MPKAKPKNKQTKGKQNVFTKIANKFNSMGKASQVLVLTLMIGIIGGGGFAVYNTYAATGIVTKPPVAPTVYFSPTNQKLANNETFTVQLRENSGTKSVNAVQAVFSYPVSLVDFVPTTGGINGIDFTNSAFKTAAQAVVDTKTGTITIARGSVTALTGDKLIASLKFKTKTTGGEIKLSFKSATSLVSNTTNTNILPGSSAYGNATYISNPSNTQCYLLGRVWADGVCKTTCLSGAGTYASSTPWGYCSNAIDKKITQTTCNDLNRVWINNGCARYWDRSSLTNGSSSIVLNAKQCKFTTNAYDLNSTNDKCYELKDINSDSKVDIFDLSIALSQGTIKDLK